MKISKQTLAKLRDYFLEGGSTAEEDVMSFLDTEDEDVMQAYIDALRETYPKDFGGELTEQEGENATMYQLKDENNILRELEVVRVKGDRVILQIKEPKELVTIVLRGETVTVDLIQLRKAPEGTTHGVANAKLIELAELAK